MSLANKTLVLVGGLAFGFLLSYAQGLVPQDTRTEENAVSLNPNRRTAQTGKAATVILIVNAADGIIGNGSGFFVRRDLVVTSVHVLAGIYGESHNWEVKSVNQPIRHTIKGVVASDPEHDLVILKVEGKEAGVLQLGDSDTMKLGEKVIAVGTHGSTHKNALGERDHICSRIMEDPDGR